MKKLILAALLFSHLTISAQQTEKQIIHEQVNLFFKALETRDTVLYKKLVFGEGQMWIVRNHNDTLKNSHNGLQQYMIGLARGKSLIEERAFMMDIKVHRDIAMAWVPYQLSGNGKLSHCGIDVFTFLNTKEGWKIVNISFSVEPEACAEIKQKYPVD